MTQKTSEEIVEEKVIDLRNVLKPYRGSWVALADTTKVVAKGKTFKEAYDKAKKKGYEDALITKASSSSGSYIL